MRRTFLSPTRTITAIIATAGSTVHVETFAKRYYLNSPLDTVLEITDQNGVQLTTGCNQPGGTTTDFSSPCLNDDVSASPHIQDSMLDYKAPTSTPTQTVLVHVLDWSGNARPDMIYNLQISGVIDPLVFSSGPGNFYCIINNPCSPFMMVNGGVIPITFSLSVGTLPPGVKLSGNTISGAATSTGTYNYTIQATDQVNQTATLQQTITVVSKLALSTTSLPSATVNIAMTVRTSGNRRRAALFLGYRRGFTSERACFDRWHRQANLCCYSAWYVQHSNLYLRKHYVPTGVDDLARHHHAVRYRLAYAERGERIAKIFSQKLTSFSV